MFWRVSDVIPEMLEQLGIAERVWCTRAAQLWSDAAESVRRGAGAASVAQPGRRGTVRVSVRSSAWQTELATRRADLLAAVNARVGHPVVERLEFRVAGRDLRRAAARHYGLSPARPAPRAQRDM